jgi:hypothetical protein
LRSKELAVRRLAAVPAKMAARMLAMHNDRFGIASKQSRTERKDFVEDLARDDV